MPDAVTVDKILEYDIPSPIPTGKGQRKGLDAETTWELIESTTDYRFIPKASEIAPNSRYIFPNQTICYILSNF